MSNKPARWFERLADGRVAVYDQPYAAAAQSVSLVQAADLPYYRNNFDLGQVWAPDDTPVPVSTNWR